MTTATTLFEQATFSGDPTSVTCAVTVPAGTITLYTFGLDAALTRVSSGVYQVAIPYTQSASAANPYVFYWVGPPYAVQHITMPTVGTVVGAPVPRAQTASASLRPGGLLATLYTRHTAFTQALTASLRPGGVLTSIFTHHASSAQTVSGSVTASGSLSLVFTSGTKPTSLPVRLPQPLGL